MFIGFLIVDIFGTSWIHVAGLESWIAPVTIVGIAVAYMLGVLVDRLCDTMYDRIRDRLTNRLGLDYKKDHERAEQRKTEAARRRGTPQERISDAEPSFGVSKARLLVMAHEGEMAKFLEYQRSRIRIARSTAFNFAGILPVAAVFAAIRAHSTRGSKGVALFAVGVGLGVLFLWAAFFALVRIDQAYIRRLDEARQIVGAPHRGQHKARV